MNQRGPVISLGVLMATACLVAGCGGKKPDTVVQPHLTWLLAHPQAVAADRLQQDMADLFTPFRVETPCGPRAVFPQVDAVWMSGGKPVSAPVVAVDPVKLSASHQNSIQKVFGKKPAFSQLAKLAHDQIARDPLPEGLAKDGLVFAGSEELQGSTVARQPYDLVVLRMNDSAANAASTRLKAASANPSDFKAIAVELTPEKLQAAIVAAFCADGSTRDASRAPEILVVDAVAQGSGRPVNEQVGIAPPEAETKAAKLQGQQALQAGNARSAEANANRAAANELIKSAIAKLSRSNLAGAEQDLKLAGERDPGQPLVYYNLGVLRLRQGSTDAALRAFDQSFKAGFKAFDLMEADTDLAGLRKDPRFQDLVKRYSKPAG